MEKEDFDIVDAVNIRPPSKQTSIDSLVIADSYNDF